MDKAREALELAREELWRIGSSESEQGALWAVREALAALDEGAEPVAYQARVHDWMMACFNDEIAFSVQERNHRFLEEALELVQSQGCTKSEALQLVDYVFDREIGEPTQEVGGVLVCLAALCTASKIDMDAAGETELARIWTKVEKIRAKHAAKPQFSPLPGASPAEPVAGVIPAGCIGPICQRRDGVICADNECDIASGIYVPAAFTRPKATPEPGEAEVAASIAWVCDDVLPAYGIASEVGRNDPELATSARAALKAARAAR